MPKNYISQAKVLVIDDEPSNVRLLERILTFAGCPHVKGTTDSRTALGLLLEFGPDIVLLDLNMPHFDGFAIMNQFSAVLDPDVYLPVLVLTADITAETKRRALASGAKDFVTKPIDQSEVILRIKNLVENRFLHLEMQRQNALLEQQVRERTAELEDTLHRLRSTQELAIRQDRLKNLGIMAGGIAHEFNNLLATISTSGELLSPWLHAHASHPETTYLANMLDATKDAAKVVSRLRESYRPSSGAESNLPVDLNEVVEKVVRLTEPKWKAKCLAEGVQIDVRTELREIPYVAGNAHELREVLTNLIFNSIDAMPDGGSITLSTRAVTDGVCISVTDTGIGMTELERQRCLEPFFTTKGDHGTGLGLSIICDIVQRHFGTIDIESEVGVGTTFFVRLPSTTATASAPEHRTERVDRALRLMVVDDNENFGFLLSEQLKGDGHSLACACNGHKALDLLGAEHFDLVITDQSMPGMNGVQLGVAIKQSWPKTKVILLTGFGEDMMSDGCPTGVDLIVAKPVSHANLRNAIFKVMAGQAALEPVSQS